MAQLSFDDRFLRKSMQCTPACTYHGRLRLYTPSGASLCVANVHRLPERCGAFVLLAPSVSSKDGSEELESLSLFLKGLSPLQACATHLMHRRTTASTRRRLRALRRMTMTATGTTAAPAASRTMACTAITATSSATMPSLSRAASSLTIRLLPAAALHRPVQNGAWRRTSARPAARSVLSTLASAAAWPDRKLSAVPPVSAVMRAAARRERPWSLQRARRPCTLGHAHLHPTAALCRP